MFSMMEKVPTTSNVYRPFGKFSCIKVITNDATTLCVTTFPFETAVTDAVRCQLAVPAAYVLVGGASASLAYAGETHKFTARVQKHIKDPTKAFARTVYVLSGRDRKINKNDSVYFQQLLMEGVEKAGVVRLANEQPPADAGITVERQATLDRMMSDAWDLLEDAGCTIFTPTRVNSCTDGAEGNEDVDRADMAFGVSIPPGSEPFDLRYGNNVWARGYCANPQDLRAPIIVVPGSLMRTDHNISTIDRIRDRRELLLTSDVVEEVPNAGVARFMTTCLLPTRAIAAKVLCGAHCGTEKWKSVHCAGQLNVARDGSVNDGEQT